MGYFEVRFVVSRYVAFVRRVTPCDTVNTVLDALSLSAHAWLMPAPNKSWTTLEVFHVLSSDTQKCHLSSTKRFAA
jgi:hypothetical protein